MKATITVTGFCASGGHVHITATSGEESIGMTISRKDLADARAVSLQDPDIKAKLLALMINRVKDLRASTAQEIKSAIEGQEFEL